MHGLKDEAIVGDYLYAGVTADGTRVRVVDIQPGRCEPCTYVCKVKLEGTRRWRKVHVGNTPENDRTIAEDSLPALRGAAHAAVSFAQKEARA